MIVEVININQQNKSKDITDKKFGRLTVLELDKEKNIPENLQGCQKYRYFWKCKCECGNIVSIRRPNLTSGTKSCGCLQKETVLGHGKIKSNTYDLTGDFGIGYTTKGETFYFDLEDYELINQCCWSVEKRGNYLVSFLNKKRVKMHQLVMNDKFIDHINRKVYDNRKINLRKANKSTNEMNKGIRANNKTGITGVCLNKKNKFIAQIKKGNIHLTKEFATKEEAILCRLKWEKDLFGEYSGQKHLFEKYGVN